MKEDALHTVQKVRKPKEVSYTKTACHKLRCIFLLIGWFISKMTVSSVVFLDGSQKNRQSLLEAMIIGRLGLERQGRKGNRKKNFKKRGH